MRDGPPPPDHEPSDNTLSRLVREVFEGDKAAQSSWAGALYRGAVIGRFQLVREIGHGGFGAVWEARDQQLKRTVAFKAVHAPARSTSNDLAMAEAEVAAHLSHPHIVTLFDVGHCEHGTFLVMEYLSGRSLRGAVRDGPLAPADAVRVALQVAQGLAHAHSKGVLHRDLTAGNVFVCDDGVVKLLDLGLSRLLATPAAGVDPAAGTPGFEPPERLRGEPEDERSDLFGLGAILHLMLTGSKPSPAEDRSAVASRLPGPPSLVALTTRLLDADPARRPASAAEVLRELGRIRLELGGGPEVEARPIAPRRRTGRRWIAGAVAASLLLALLVAAWFLRAPAPAEVASPEAPRFVLAVAEPVLAAGQVTTARVEPTSGGEESPPLARTAWQSSNPRIASVDAHGAVRALAEGTVTLTATVDGVSGSTSVVVTGPDWELVSASGLAPPPAGTVPRGETPRPQRVATVGGRSAWFQPTDEPLLFVPMDDGALGDVVAVQADLWVAEPGRTVAVSPFRSPNVMAFDADVDVPGDRRWRTLRVELSREPCAIRVLLDGAEVRGGRLVDCDVQGRYVRLSAGVTAGQRAPAPANVAWSNLRVFRGTPVDAVVLVVQRLPPGGGAYARIIATPVDRHGNRLLHRVVEWRSSDPSVASVDDAGLVRALRRGEVTITARCGGKISEKRIRVEAAGQEKSIATAIRGSTGE